MVSSTFVLALAGLSTFAQAAPTISKRASGKAGYAFGKENQAKIEMFSPANGCWGYNWDSKVAQANNVMVYKLPGGCEFVPMLHDNTPMFVDAWKLDAPKAVAAGSKHLLSFNEPDHCSENYKEEGGTCIPIAEAVAKHKDLIGPYSGKDIKIGSPAVTNGDKGNVGLKWLQNFMNACQDCQIDFINIHWQQTPDCDVSIFTQHVEKAHKMFNKPIWVTEFQAPLSSADPVGFMKSATKWLDQQSYVKRYAYFSVDAKMTNNGALNDLGAAYANV